MVKYDGINYNTRNYSLTSPHSFKARPEYLQFKWIFWDTLHQTEQGRLCTTIMMSQLVGSNFGVVHGSNISCWWDVNCIRADPTLCTKTLVLGTRIAILWKLKGDRTILWDKKIANYLSNHHPFRISTAKWISLSPVFISTCPWLWDTISHIRAKGQLWSLNSVTV